MNDLVVITTDNKIVLNDDYVSDYKKLYNLNKKTELATKEVNQRVKDFMEANGLETLAAKFSPYVNTYILLDLYQKLEYKDSPIDKGKDTLEFLLEHKILIPSFSINRTKGRKNGKNRKI